MPHFCREIRQSLEDFALNFASQITPKTLLTMNILEQMLAFAAIIVSGAGIRTIFSAVALRRRLK